MTRAGATGVVGPRGGCTPPGAGAGPRCRFDEKSGISGFRPFFFMVSSEGSPENL